MYHVLTVRTRSRPYSGQHPLPRKESILTIIPRGRGASRIQACGLLVISQARYLSSLLISTGGGTRTHIASGLSRRSLANWNTPACLYSVIKSGWQDSNLRPHSPKERALPTVLHPVTALVCLHSLRETLHSPHQGLIKFGHHEGLLS